MRLIFFIIISFVTSFSLNAQSDAENTDIRTLLDESLDSWRLIAMDSISFYKKMESSSVNEGRRLMKNDIVAQKVFGHSVPQIYESRYGRDTAQLILATVNNWETYRGRRQRWENAFARIVELDTQNGRKELYQRYGDDLVGLLQQEKKRAALVQNEIVRGVIFFHKWPSYSFVENRLKGYSGPAYASIQEVAKNVTQFASANSIGTPLPTVSAGGTLSFEKIIYSYPQNQQTNFYLYENQREDGEVVLRNYANFNLRQASEDGKLWARWKGTNGRVLYTRAVVSGAKIVYRIPGYFLNRREIYQLSIVKSNTDLFNSVLDFYAKKDIAQLIALGVYHKEKVEVEPEEIFFQAYFRVSQYGSFYSKVIEQKFVRVAAPGTVYQFTPYESFGAEEISNLHGLGAQARFTSLNCPAAEDVLYKLYDHSTKVFYSHPRQEYVDYLKRNRDSLNIDSLIAIEFLPLKERLLKYQRLRYLDAEGRQRTTFSRGLPLPTKPEQNRYLYISTENAQIIDEAIFINPNLYKNQRGSVIIRDTFADVVQRIALDMAPLLETRFQEYVDVLRQLNELSPQKIGGQDFYQLAKSINPWYHTDPHNEKLLQIKTCFPEKVYLNYGYPAQARLTGAYQMEVMNPEE